MTTQPGSYLEAAERLCATLERIGDALVDLDTATLLETEETLSRLLTALASDHSAENSAALVAVARRGLDALRRCRQLEASYSSVARVRLQLCTRVGGYGADGDYVEAASTPSLRATA